MTLHVALTHRTAYHYDRVIGMAPQVIRLRPAPHCRTPILSYSLNIEPKLHFINWQQDPFANYCARVVLPEKTDRFVVTVDLVADMAVINPFDFFVEEGSTDWPFAYDARTEERAAARTSSRCRRHRCSRNSSPPSRRRRKSPSTSSPTSIASVRNEVSYCVRLEPGIQTPEETLDQSVRLVPRFRLAAGAGAAPHRLRRALRLRLPDPAAARREAARRRRCRRRSRLHRPARLGRGLPARRRLDRPRSDLRPARRRGPYSAGGHAAAVERGADQRRP